MKKSLIAIFLVVLGIGLYQTWSMKREVDSRYSKEGLQKIVDEVNISTPVMADEMTRLDRASADHGLFVYHYTLLNNSKSEIDLKHFQVQMLEALSASACSDEKFKEFFKRGIELHYSYKDKNQDSIADININASVCGRKA